MNKNILLSVLVLLLAIIGLSLIPIEKTISKSVPYQEAVYKTVENTIYVQKSETRYKTESVTKYRSVYYGTLKDSGAFLQSDTIWTFDNAIKLDKEYTRQGAREEYKFIITNIDGTTNYYYDIDVWDIKQKQVPYTDTVTTPYDVSISVPQTVQEKVIDRYDTKYKTEYVNVTKSLILWIFG